MLILREQQCCQVVDEGTRHWRHNQVEDLILKLCKEVGYQVKSQPFYGHGVIPNSSPEDSEVGSVAADGSKGDKDDGIDFEKDVRSEVNSAANESSKTVSHSKFWS
jgi:hypothetical protein